MSEELREKAADALRQAFRAGWWYRDKKPNLSSTVEERNRAEDEFMASGGSRRVEAILALHPTEGEPTDEQWEIVRQHVLSFAAYVLARGGLDVEGHKGDRAVYDATVTGACLRFSVSDEPAEEIMEELRARLRRTPETDALKLAQRPPPFEDDDIIRERLGCITDDMAEAYRIGAEEAQNEIVGRIAQNLATQDPETEAKATTFVFTIDIPPEPAAGLRGFNDRVTIAVEESDETMLADDPEWTFADHMKEALAEWFDTPYVALSQDPNAGGPE